MNAEKLALSIASILLLIFFSLILYGAKDSIIKVSENKYEIHYIARQFSFFPMELRIPKGSILDIYITSPDVTHGFHIEGTNVNLMVIPGAITYYRAKFDNPGEYRIYCHEYCGLGHQNMMSKIIVE